MPAPVEAVVRPQQNTIVVNLEPVHNALYSMLLIVRVDRLSGLGEWVTNTHDELTPAELANHRLVLEGLHYALIPRRSWPRFEAYLDWLEAMDPVALRDLLLPQLAGSRGLDGRTVQAAWNRRVRDPARFDRASDHERLSWFYELG